MDKRIKISVIVIQGGNYDRDLYKKCLESVSWADEIIKVDGDKIDGSFSKLRNYGAKLASGEWILYIDTDETVTKELKKDILNNITSGNFAGYAIPRRNIFLGHEMHWGGWSPDYVLRLIKKDKLIAWEGELHEQPKISGEIGNLSEPLIHISHKNLSEMVEKTNKWSEIEAKLMYNAQHPPMNFIRFFSAGFREFWYRAVVKLGFLDGKIGIIEIIYQVFSRLISYSKLWELQIKHNESSNL